MDEGDVDIFLHDQQEFCRLLIAQNTLKNETNNYCCPPSFDGLFCWPRTLPGLLATLPCPPKFVMGYKNPENTVATKQCMSNGEWYENHDDIKWSNYSLCTPPSGIINIEIHHSNYETAYNSSIVQKWLPIIKNVANIGYASSLITLVIAMIIFSLLRKLRNRKNRLHMHMFASFVMRATMSILKNWLFIDGIGLSWDIITIDDQSTFIKERNSWVCKAITSLWQYSIVANYAWIMMEGLYLHNLIFISFCRGTTEITYYVILGWTLPGIVVTIWIIIRIYMEDTFCWTTHDNRSLFYIIRIPIILSILFNFLLFINIVRVLLIKMKTSLHLQRKKMQYGKFCQSTLVLIPLFGAHYTILLGLSYYEDHRIELIWLFCDQLFASFQGCFVALLYCLLNGEVRAEVKKAWQIYRSRRDVDLITLTNRYITKSPESRQRLSRSTWRLSRPNESVL